MHRSAARALGTRVLLLFLLAASACLISADLAAAFTTTWDASSGLLPDQVPCPWVKVNNTANQPALTGGHLLISTNTTGSNNTYYQQTGAQLSMPSDSLVVEFRCRYVSGATGNTTRAPVAVEIEVTAFRGTVFFVDNGAIFFNSGPFTRGGTATLPTSDAMHTYRMVIIGTALRIYRDGVLALTGSTFFDNSQGSFAGFARILWGEASSLAYGTSEWEFLTHNASPGASCGVTITRTPTWGGLKLLYR